MFYTFDYETEVGKKSSFPNLVNYLKHIDDDVEVVNPICLKAYNGSKYFDGQTFLQFCEWLRRNGERSVELYAHNVKKFDGEIILYELLTKGWKQVVDIESDKTKISKLEKEHEKKGRFLNHKEFSIIGKSLNLMATLEIKYYNLKIKIVDSLNIFQGSLEKFAKSMDVERKGDYNFKEHVNGTNHPQIKKYCRQDCRVLHKCLKKLFSIMESEKPTSASISLEKYKEFVDFNLLFPTLDELYRDISTLSYQGGVCHLNKKYEGVELKNTASFDITSSYSHQMRNKLLPYGKPKHVKKINTKKYQEIICYINYKTKKGYHPFYRPFKSKFVAEYFGLENEVEYKLSLGDMPKNFEGWVVINSYDLATLKTCSHVKVEVIHDIIEYSTNYLFTEFVDHFFKMKDVAEKNGDEASKNTAKIILNSLYGKFAQWLSGENKIHVLNNNEWSYKKYRVDDLCGIFMPLASAITARARETLQDVRNLLRKLYIYSDTDSVHSEEYEESLKIMRENGKLSDKLGKWKDEGRKIIAKYLGKKTYVHMLENGKKVFACVGLRNNDLQDLDISDFKLGKEIKTQKSKLIIGGRKIFDTTYSIRRFG